VGRHKELLQEAREAGYTYDPVEKAWVNIHEFDAGPMAEVWLNQDGSIIWKMWDGRDGDEAVPAPTLEEAELEALLALEQAYGNSATLAEIDNLHEMVAGLEREIAKRHG